MLQYQQKWHVHVTIAWPVVADARFLHYTAVIQVLLFTAFLGSDAYRYVHSVRLSRVVYT